MKLLKLAIFFFLLCLSNQQFIQGMEDHNSEFNTKTNTILVKNKNDLKAGSSLFCLSRDFLRKNIKRFCNTTKADIALNKEFQALCLLHADDEKLKKIYFEALDLSEKFGGKTVEHLRKKTLSELIQLFATPKAGSPLFCLSRDFLRKNIKRFCNTTKADIALNKEFQALCLLHADDEKLKKIYFEALDLSKKFDRKTVEHLRKKTLSELIQLFATPKAGSPLFCLSLDYLYDNIKKFDDITKAKIANHKNFQKYYLQNSYDNTLKEIYFQALNLSKKYDGNSTLTLIKELSIQALIKLNNDQTIGQYKKLQQDLKLLKKQYDKKMKKFEENGYSKKNDFALAQNKYDTERKNLENQISVILYRVELLYKEDKKRLNL